MEMSNWKGAAGICVNDKNEVLLVLQGPPGEEKKWGVPSGGQEAGETLRESCEREFQEETGLSVRAFEELTVKRGTYENAAVSFELHYFRVELTGGEIMVLADDEWIADVAWKPIEGLAELNLAYPDDIPLIESLVRN
ncbi:ADP-ribose pyrophosphatase YjhB (NUDIX family) [Planomicrobium soli]|uniref:ADP-ribose pyrophosphatase YjhB (NUDIX family) n=1 Tax=Planomicrobium soli TaxID=1176648 RepID=A0A2P8H2K3_9BACL|nr:NUDIX hydrolase [Planomicrobium soli]PSL40446.1 ADP-ribose pyrophosphatase YjhB (NUDIX family) [Planomicrobium soli]